MKKYILLILIVIVGTITAHAGSPAEFKEGDIVFQISKSSQSKYIQLATGSIWSHCGIVVMKHGKCYILEAASTVRLTPLNDWVERGRGGIVKQRRIFEKPVKIKYEKYLGQKYDLAFKFNNGKMYCSELVYEIYKNQFNIRLATPRPVKDYHVFGLGSLMKRRGIDRNQLVVAPCDLLN